MTLSSIFTMLNSITGFAGKVCYQSFPANEAPQLPYICYYEENCASFSADNTVYQGFPQYRVMLLTAVRDRATETLVETALRTNNIVWNKTISYLNDEKCFQIDYNFTEVE